MTVCLCPPLSLCLCVCCICSCICTSTGSSTNVSYWVYKCKLPFSFSGWGCGEHCYIWPLWDGLKLKKWIVTITYKMLTGIVILKHTTASHINCCILWMCTLRWIVVIGQRMVTQSLWMRRRSSMSPSPLTRQRHTAPHSVTRPTILSLPTANMTRKWQTPLLHNFTTLHCCVIHISTTCAFTRSSSRKVLLD